MARQTTLRSGTQGVKQGGSVEAKKPASDSGPIKDFFYS